MLTFKAPKSEFQRAAKHMKHALPKDKAKLQQAVEIKFMKNEIELSTIGASYRLYGKSEGAGRASMSLLQFADIVLSQDGEYIEVKFAPGLFESGKSGIKGTSVKVDSEGGMPATIDLAINYKLSDLLRLRDKYPWDQIEFNNLAKTLEKAEEDLEYNIEKAYTILKQYDISRSELKTLVHVSVYGEKAI